MEEGNKQGDSTAVVAEAGNAKGTVPPTVITVDTGGKEEEATPSKSADAASQARTPKHANKDDSKGKGPETSSLNDGTTSKAPSFAGGSFAAPPRPFEGRVGGSGAFQPHERQSYQHPNLGLPPMQVSPGSGRYYAAFSGTNSRYGPPPAAYDYSNGPGFQRPGAYAGPPMYSQQYQGTFDSTNPSWGAPPSFPQGRPPAYPNAPVNHGEYHPPPHQNTNSTFSRAVSGSFDRSIKSREGKLKVAEDAHHLGPPHHADDRSTGDASWGQLNQVASVDEEEMRKRLTKREDTPEEEKEVAVTHANSNNSSLTNSPTEGLEDKKLRPKGHSSLDSLSSVASAQAPVSMQPKTLERKSTYSPAEGSSTSLDLMKCASGSSALLLPSHQRNDSFIFGNDHTLGVKRSHEEGREDLDTNGHGGTEIRKAPSEDLPRPRKKGRKDNGRKKSSPLSIDCSPPTSPSAEKRRGSKSKGSHHLYSNEPTSMDSFYDKPPSYTYSIESAPRMPRDPALSGGRPGSSSSTITPMQVEGGHEVQELRPQPQVGAIPSWEIHAQDSFGAGSAHGPSGGGQLMSAFSFSQDYPMIGASATELVNGHPSAHHALESRNQSFEGGHYHGGFNRSDSMMSYEGHPSSQALPPYDGRNGYHGPFPPQAPSWGSASSFPPNHHGYAQYQNYPPPMMRNYSEDSGHRASPPPGPLRGAVRSFQPPPEFRAPPSMVNKGGSAQHVISTAYVSGSRAATFGWSKEEDNRLTDIMKKYKNPRDWEPIAKEHDFGRS